MGTISNKGKGDNQFHICIVHTHLVALCSSVSLCLFYSFFVNSDPKDEMQPSPMSTIEGSARSPGAMSTLNANRPQSTPPYIDDNESMSSGPSSANIRQGGDVTQVLTEASVRHFIQNPDVHALNLLLPESQRLLMERVKKEMEMTKEKINREQQLKGQSQEQGEAASRADAAPSGPLRSVKAESFDQPLSDHVMAQPQAPEPHDPQQFQHHGLLKSLSSEQLSVYQDTLNQAGGIGGSNPQWSQQQQVQLHGSDSSQSGVEVRLTKATLQRRRSETALAAAADPSKLRLARKIQATSPPMKTKGRSSRPYASMPSSPYSSQHNLDQAGLMAAEHHRQLLLQSQMQQYNASLQHQLHRSPGHVRSASESAGTCGLAML